MINELLWVLLMLATFLGIILAYRFFGKVGLYSWMAMAIIIANIQVMKTVAVFGFVTALGNIIYGTTFLVTDIINENYGAKEAKKAVWIGFFVLISVTVLMQISVAFVPHASDTQSGHIASIFGLFLPILVASLSAYLISQTFDVWFYDKLKKITKKKYLWLRNNLSTMVSQLIDNVIFTGIFFVGYFLIFETDRFLGWPVIISIFFTSYVMKLVVAALDTPFIYWSKDIKKKYLKKD